MTKVTLKAARINAGLNQHQAASLLKISRATLVKWEQGKTFPDAPAIDRICSLYGLHYDNISFLPNDSLIANNIL